MDGGAGRLAVEKPDADSVFGNVCEVDNLTDTVRVMAQWYGRLHYIVLRVSYTLIAALRSPV